MFRLIKPIFSLAVLIFPCLFFWGCESKPETGGIQASQGSEQAGIPAHDDHADHHGPNHGHGSDERTTQITVWHDVFELFIEHPLLVSEMSARFVTHVTHRETYLPRTAGPVIFQFRDANDQILEIKASAPVRDGIYLPEVTLPSAGTWGFTLVIPEGQERHRVSLPDVQVFASQHDAGQSILPPDLDGISFLKEQQWKIPFRTETMARRAVKDQMVWSIPGTAITREQGYPTVFVQLGGEVFEQRRVEPGDEDGPWIELLSGVKDDEQVVVAGVEALVEAAKSEAIDHDETGHNGHDHGKHVTGDVSGESVVMSPSQCTQYGIKTGIAQPGDIVTQTEVQGEVLLDMDKSATVITPMSGTVREVRFGWGSPVAAGAVLALIESAEWAQAQAHFSQACARLDVAERIFQREKKLWQSDRTVSTEQDFLDARRERSEAIAEKRASAYTLTSLGCPPEHLERLCSDDEATFSILEIRAPLAGEIVGRQMVIGEWVDAGHEAFKIADLTTVWADLRVHPSTAAVLELGQEITVRGTTTNFLASGPITYIAPLLDERTRTVLVRASLPNPNRLLRPGLFVNAQLPQGRRHAAVRVPRDAVQYIADRPIVFVYQDGTFNLREIELGSEDGRYMEVIRGLSSGENIAIAGAFRIKSEIESRTTGDIGHGHVH